MEKTIDGTGYFGMMHTSKAYAHQPAPGFRLNTKTPSDYSGGVFVCMNANYF